MDRLLGPRQEAVENALARRHLRENTLVLYDVTISWKQKSAAARCPLGVGKLTRRRVGTCGRQIVKRDRMTDRDRTLPDPDFANQ